MHSEQSLKNAVVPWYSYQLLRASATTTVQRYLLSGEVVEVGRLVD